MYNKDSKITYYTSEEFEIKGRRKGTELPERLTGFEFLLSEVNNKSVLDLGCAEGLISLEFAKNGCNIVNGFDVQDISIKTATKIFEDSDIKIPYKFKQANLNNFENFVESVELLGSYDIILFLGVYHHLDNKQANLVLRDCFTRANDYVVIRTDSAIPILPEMQNFKLIKDDNCKNITGRLRVYKKIK